MKLFYSVLLFISGFVSLSANAVETVRIDTVDVVAHRIDANEIDSEFQTGNLRVVKVSESTKSMATVADLLEQEPSVQVRHLAGIGSYSSVSIRGSSSDQVNVYLDGVLINDAYGGSVDLSQFLLNNVDSIEIYRGGVPVQLGAAGIGGAINIVTKESVGEFGGRFELGYGSFNSKKASSTWTGEILEASYQGSISYLGADNDFKFLNDNRTPNNFADDVVERRRNSGFEQLSGMLSLRSKLEGQRRLKAVLQYENKNKQVPNALNDPINDASYNTSFSSLRLDLDDNLSASSNISYQFFAAYKTSEFLDLSGRVGIARNDEIARLSSTGLQIDLSNTIGAHVINLHAEFDFQDYRVRDHLERIDQEVSRLRSRIAIQDDWVNDDGSILLVARSGLESNQDKDHLRDNADSNNTYFDWHLGAKYWLRDEWSISANLSKDIRTPKLNELFGNQGNSKGNDDLTEEYAFNADFGLGYDSSLLKLDSSFFYRDLDDAIVIIYDSQGTGKAHNISKASVQGLEIEIEFPFNNELKLNTNFTSQKSETLSGSPASVGKPLPGIYETVFVTKFSYQHDRYRAELGYSHNSGGFYDSEGVAEKPSTNQFSLFGEYAFGVHKVAIRVENLNDEPVKHFNYFPGPGRSIFISYNTKF